MPLYLLLGFFAFVICLIVTPVCRDIFLRFDLVDMPDDDRKLHKRPVPRVGGIPIAFSYGASLLLVFLLNFGGGKIHVQHEHLFKVLLPAAAIIFATGLIDDIFGLKPWHKLLGQFAGASLAVGMGVRMQIAHLNPIAGAVLSLVWIVACTNAVNLIDGMDGLATGVGLLATLSTMLVAILSGNHGLALVTVPLLGCLLAFLRYNFSPATVFLGDCGSLSIGFALGCFSLIWSQHTGTLLGMIAPLMALALPLIDVGLAIGRRFLRSVPIFKGDRGHIHHMVLGLGLSTRRATLLLYGVCGVSATLAILASFGRGRSGGFVVFIFLSLVILGVERLGYIEFAAARRALSHQVVRRAVSDEIYLHEFAQEVFSAESTESWWHAARKSFVQLGFASAELELYGRYFHEQFVVSRRAPSCTIHLDLGDRGYVILTRQFEKSPPRILMSVLRTLQDSVESDTGLLAKSPQAISLAENAATANVA